MRKIDTVRALLRHAEKAASEQEADAYFDKAVELMAKWSLSEEDLAAPADWYTTEVKFQGQIAEVHMSVYHSVIEALGTCGVYGMSGRMAIVVVGDKEEVDASLLMAHRLWSQIHQKLLVAYAEARSPSWVRSYALSFSKAAVAKIRGTAARHTGRLGSEVEVWDKKSQIDKVVKEAFSFDSARKIGSVDDLQAAIKGRTDGERADIGRDITIR